MNTITTEDERRATGRTLPGQVRRLTDEIRRYRNDIQFRLAIILRKRIQKVVRRGMKSAATSELIGCSGEELRAHLEKQFIRGMNWGNAGKWHIEHRIPCASFDLSDPKQQRICFHFTNLRPMWAAQNLAKGDKLEKHEQLPLVQ